MIKKKLLLSIIFFLCIFLISNLIPFSSFLKRDRVESHPFQSNTIAKYTYIFYGCADNNLERYGLDDVNEMEAGFNDSVTDVHVIALLDIYKGGTTAFYISHDTDINTITSTYLVVPGLPSEANMGNPTTLITFVEFCMANYPAENYILDLWNHGSGWEVCFDDSSSGDALTMAELRNALATINTTDQIDILCMDACLMGTVSVAYELRDYVSILVASEDAIPVLGFPYDTVIADLCDNPTQNITIFASNIVDLFYASLSFYTIQLSAVNLTAIEPDFYPSFANFAQNLYTNLDFGIKNELYTARLASEEFYDRDFIDLYDFAQETKKEASNATIILSAQNLMDAIESAIINQKQHNNPGAYGLSIYFPRSQSAYLPQYPTLFLLCNDSMWDEFLVKYYTSVTFGLGLQYFGINDTLGNNNNTPDPGETLLLEIMLKNIGGIDAYSANGTLICLDTDNVTISAAFQSYNSIPQSTSATGTFIFNISETCTINQKISFTIMTKAVFNTQLVIRNFTFELIVGLQITPGGRTLASATEIFSGTIHGILPGPATDGMAWLKINCTTNYYLYLNLTGPELTDFDAYVYDSTENLLTVAGKATYPDECSLFLMQDGYYYIKLDPYSGGNCYYELFVNISTESYEDGSYFGLALTLDGIHTVNGTLPGIGPDGQLYYRIFVRAGQVIRANLEGPSGTDFDLYILDASLNKVAESISPSSSESCSIKALTTGYYYIILDPFSGTGNFTLEVKIELHNLPLWFIFAMIITIVVVVACGVLLYLTTLRKSRPSDVVEYDLSDIHL